MQKGHWRTGLVDSTLGLADIALVAIALGLAAEILDLVALESLQSEGLAVLAQDDQVTLDSRGTRFWRAQVSGHAQSITAAQPG